MATPVHHATFAEIPFTDAETRALEALRLRFEQDHDLLSARERAHLCFLRWLVQTGRLQA